MGESSDCQSVQLVSVPRSTRDGAELEKHMNTREVTKAFNKAKTARQYKAALAKARRLSGKRQLVVLDSMFEAAGRLGVERSTGAPLGMQQELDGSVTVTWKEKVQRPDGSFVVVASSAVLEPNDYGSGWRSKTKDVPDEVVNAVMSAAAEETLKPRVARAKRRVYVRA